MPSITWPHTVYWRSRKVASSKTMKNWLLALFGSLVRAIDPNSANSQFFIVFDDATFLDRQYTVWGQVIEGMEHVDALPKGEPPRNPGKIVKATVQ